MAEEISTDTPQTEQTEKTRRRKPDIFYNFIYVERESPIDGVNTIAASSSQFPVAHLKDTMRALMVLEGTIQKFDPETKRGEIEVEGKVFPFIYPRSDDYSKWMGEKHFFSFYPTSDEAPPENIEISAFSTLKMVSRRKSKAAPHGYAEVVGKLERIFDGGFVVSIRSLAQKSTYYIIFNDDYPYPDEVGKFVWVEGKFDVATATLKFKEATAIAFVPKEEAKRIAAERKKQRERAQKEAATGKGKSKSKLKTAPKPPKPICWDELAKEINRVMVNAKLKIVLKELPASLKESGDFIFFPLTNQAKAVPGSVELADTSVDLLVTKKMWKKAKKKADSLQEETGKAPIHIIEALIGLKENRLAAVASGIQVTEGKG